MPAEVGTGMHGGAWRYPGMGVPVHGAALGYHPWAWVPVPAPQDPPDQPPRSRDLSIRHPEAGHLWPEGTGSCRPLIGDVYGLSLTISCRVRGLSGP